MPKEESKNVLGNPLSFFAKGAGYNKDGYCRTNPDDKRHLSIAATLTHAFLQCEYGDDDYTSQGLKSGDKTCLSAYDFKNAVREMGPDKAPHVDLGATHEKALDVVGLEDLRRFAKGKERDGAL